MSGALTRNEPGGARGVGPEAIREAVGLEPEQNQAEIVTWSHSRDRGPETRHYFEMCQKAAVGESVGCGR